MRGKKEYFDPLYSSANSELVDDNSISDYGQDFYEQLQDERRLLNEFGQIYGLDTQLPNEFNSEQDYNKETPWESHVMDNDESTSEDEEESQSIGIEKRDIRDEINEEKRAPNSGFYGMRGKKAPLVIQSK